MPVQGRRSGHHAIQIDTPTAPSDGHSVLDSTGSHHQASGNAPGRGTFNNLYSLLNYELLWYAFRKLKRDKAPGVDGVTVDQYEENLQENLQDLVTRLHRGAIDPSPACVATSRKGMARRGRWASPAWKTRSFNERS